MKKLERIPKLLFKGHKRFFVEGKPPQSWFWKQNGITVVADSQSCEHLKKRVTDIL